MSRTVKIVVVVVVAVVVAPVLVALVARTFVIEAFKIPSGGMMPTLIPGDHLFVSKSHYGLLGNAAQVGEVVVFRYPRDPAKDFIKRIVGVAGDLIEVRNGALYRNEAAVPRCSVGAYEYDDTDGLGGRPERRQARLYAERLGSLVHLAIYDPEPIGRDGSWRVRSGQVFVMGDNRDNSHDSRYWGGVPLDDLKGRASSIWSSPVPSRAGTNLHAPPVLTGSLADSLRRCVAELSAAGG